jgi:transposase
MTRLATLLIASEITTLEACAQRGPHARQRRRAQAVLAHSRGLGLPQLARVFDVSYQTAHAWLQAWERAGVAGLAEGSRSGRPPKLDAAAKKK